MTSSWSRFAEQAACRPAAVAVHDKGCDYTYADLYESAVAFADWLEAAGTAPGDRIALLLPNCIQYISCYLGILKAGRVVVALNPETSVDELRQIVEDCQPSVIVIGSGTDRFQESIARLRDRLGAPRFVLALATAGELSVIGQCAVTETTTSKSIATTNALPRKLRDLAQIIYTSGTTGRPKGVMLSHRNLAANCQSIVEYLSLDHRDAVLVVLPFFYSYGNSLLITHLAVGGRLVLAQEFVYWNRILDLLESQKATGFAGVPSTFAMLLFRSNAAERQFRDLKYLTCAGGGLLPAQVARLREVFRRARLFLMYGQTEATARLATLMPEELDQKPGSIGVGIPGVTLTVLNDDSRRTPPGEVGEIVARGANLMMGYWNDPQGTLDVLRPEGLRTGDLAYADEDGYIYIVGRKSDMIKCGAYRISPHEIEDVILRHADLAEVAVVGHASEMWGEVPVAFVVPAEGADVDTEALLAICRRLLPRYKQPRSIMITDSLPRTASGKIRRSLLREAVPG